MGIFSPLTITGNGGTSYPPIIEKTVITYRGGTSNGQTGSIGPFSASVGTFNAATDVPYKLLITNPNTFALYLFFLEEEEDYLMRSQYAYDAVVPPNVTGDLEIGGDRIAIAIGFGGGGAATSAITYSILSKRYSEFLAP